MRISYLVLAATTALLPACVPALGGESPPATAQRADHDHHDGDDDHDDDHDPRPASPAVLAAAAKVTVLQNDDMSCETEALGLVDVHCSMHGTRTALDELKARAAALGAEAVTGVDFHHGGGGHEHTHLSGMAVRCRDLLGGRSYDVIARLDVDGAMGKEDAAFGELMSRAGAMNADLVVGIRFVHGEGGDQPTRVSGTAVRFRN